MTELKQHNGHLWWFGKHIRRKQLASDGIHLLKCPLEMLISLRWRHFPLGNQSIDLVQHQNWSNFLKPSLSQHCMCLWYTSRLQVCDPFGQASKIKLQIRPGQLLKPLRQLIACDATKKEYMQSDDLRCTLIMYKEHWELVSLLYIISFCNVFLQQYFTSAYFAHSPTMMSANNRTPCMSTSLIVRASYWSHCAN